MIFVNRFSKQEKVLDTAKKELEEEAEHLTDQMHSLQQKVSHLKMNLDEIHGITKLRANSKSSTDIVEGIYNYMQEKIDLELLQPQFATYTLAQTHENDILK
jgi:predicted nuclease with TOPRIM domain